MKRWARGVLRVLPLSFAAFLAERDRCRDRAYRSTDRVLRDAFIENTDRRYDHVSQELDWIGYQVEEVGHADDEHS